MTQDPFPWQQFVTSKDKKSYFRAASPGEHPQQFLKQFLNVAIRNIFRSIYYESVSAIVLS